MDRISKELIKTYYHARGVAIQGRRTSYKPYEYSPYALDNKIMNLHDLSISDKHEIYKNNSTVRKYIQPYIDEYNRNAKGFLRILLNYEETNDITPIIQFIQESKFIKEQEGTVEEDSYHDIDLGVDREKLLSELDLEYEYSSVASSVDAESYWDYDEANYMQGYFTGSMQAKVKQIAKTMGIGDDVIGKFWTEEGDLVEFFNDNDMGQVVETFMEYYNIAKSNAESEAAQEALKHFPFEFEHSYSYDSRAASYLDIEKTIDYFYFYDPSEIPTFDAFLAYVTDNHEINDDQVREAGYNAHDYADLNFYLERDLDTIIDAFDDPDSDYYERVQGQKDVQDILKQNGFKLIPKAKDDDPFAVREQKDKTINVVDWGYSAGDEKLQLEIELIYKTNLDKGGQVRQGWILAKNLGDYVDQYEAPQLRE